MGTSTMPLVTKNAYGYERIPNKLDSRLLKVLNSANLLLITVGFSTFTCHILIIHMALMPDERISLHHDAELNRQGSETIVEKMERLTVTWKAYGDDRFNRLFWLVVVARIQWCRILMRHRRFSCVHRPYSYDTYAINASQVEFSATWCCIHQTRVRNYRRKHGKTDCHLENIRWWPISFFTQRRLSSRYALLPVHRPSP